MISNRIGLSKEEEHRIRVEERPKIIAWYKEQEYRHKMLVEGRNPYTGELNSRYKKKVRKNRRRVRLKKSKSNTL